MPAWEKSGYDVAAKSSSSSASPVSHLAMRFSLDRGALEYLVVMSLCLRIDQKVIQYLRRSPEVRVVGSISRERHVRFAIYRTHDQQASRHGLTSCHMRQSQDRLAIVTSIVLLLNTPPVPNPEREAVSMPNVHFHVIRSVDDGAQRTANIRAPSRLHV